MPIYATNWTFSMRQCPFEIVCLVAGVTWQAHRHDKFSTQNDRFCMKDGSMHLLKLISGGVSSMCISSQISELVEDWCFILAHSAEYSCPMHRARFYAKCIILREILVMFVQSNLTLPSSNVFWHCKSDLIQNMETSTEFYEKCARFAYDVVQFSSQNKPHVLRSWESLCSTYI